MTHGSGHPALGRGQLPFPAQAWGTWGAGLRKASNHFGSSLFLFHILISTVSSATQQTWIVKVQPPSAPEHSLPGQAWAAHLSFACLSPPYPRTFCKVSVVLYITCTGQGCVPGLECAGLRSNCKLPSISWCFLWHCVWKCLKTPIKECARREKLPGKGKCCAGIKQAKWYSLPLPQAPRLMTWHPEMSVKDTVCVFITLTGRTVPLPVCRNAVQKASLTSMPWAEL